MAPRRTADTSLDREFALGADPLPDETQIGFVARLAERRRGYTTQTLMGKLGFDTPTNRWYSELGQRLARLAGTDVELLRAISLGEPQAEAATIRGRRLPFRMFDLFGTRLRRACPRCLDESAHHRCWWDVQPISACAVHGFALADHCPRCEAPLRWLGYGVRMTGCQCDADISAFDVPLVSEEERLAVALLQGFLGDERFAELAAEARSRRPFADLDDAASADFMIRFAMDLLGRRLKRFSSVGSLDLARQGHRGLAMVVAATSDWPGSFHGALDDIRVALNPDQPPTRRRVAAPMLAWLDGLPDGQGRLLREALEAWRHA